MTTIPKAFTAAEADALARALVRQIKIRQPATRLEALWAFGFPTPKGFKHPPAWVGAAIRGMHTGKTGLSYPALNAPAVVEALGAVVGMAKMWDAVLTTPTDDVTELEKKFPQLVGFRKELHQLTKSSIKNLSKTRRDVDKASLKPALRLAYVNGERTGSAAILQADGTLNESGDIRSEICFFLSLYWQQIQLLGSVSELERFFQQMKQDSVTRKNLEKICREVGLKFKKPGRPKNLLSKRPK